MELVKGNNPEKLKFIGFVVFVYWRPKTPGGQRSMAYSTELK